MVEVGDHFGIKGVNLLAFETVNDLAHLELAGFLLLGPENWCSLFEKKTANFQLLKLLLPLHDFSFPCSR